MKQNMFKLSLAAAALAACVGSNAEARSATCRYKSPDVGVIIGRGPSSEAAFEDAATQCFERRSSLHKARRGSAMDEDTGLTVIDSCANLKCV